MRLFLKTNTEIRQAQIALQHSYFKFIGKGGGG